VTAQEDFARLQWELRALGHAVLGAVAPLLWRAADLLERCGNQAARRVRAGRGDW
jgi:hypothetical protein